jgi:precorrin-6x reductase
VERRELKKEIEKGIRRVKEFEEALAEAKQAQSRVMLGSGTKEVAIKEVSHQNMILTDTIDRQTEE